MNENRSIPGSNGDNQQGWLPPGFDTSVGKHAKKEKSNAEIAIGELTFYLTQANFWVGACIGVLLGYFVLVMFYFGAVMLAEFLDLRSSCINPGEPMSSSAVEVTGSSRHHGCEPVQLILEPGDRSGNDG